MAGAHDPKPADFSMTSFNDDETDLVDYLVAIIVPVC